MLTLGWLIAGWLQDDRYSVARHDISEMGAVGAPNAAVLLVAQGLAGAGTLAFVILGFARALAGVRGRTISAILLALPLGVGNVSDAFFRLDCRRADGCTAEEMVSSWHATIHAVGGVLLLVMAVAPYVVARCLRRSPEWRSLVRPSLFFGLAIDVALIAAIALEGMHGAGYAQRVFALLAAAWVALLAARLWQLSRADSAVAHLAA